MATSVIINAISLFKVNTMNTINIERTLSIIKPDAVSRNYIGNIIQRFEMAGLSVVAMRMQPLSKEQTETFYGIHKERPFFNELVESIALKPVVLIVLEGPDAIHKNRQIMGATNPEEANAGTIRHDISISIGENSVHGLSLIHISEPTRPY